MESSDINDIKTHVLQLVESIEQIATLTWVAECARATQALGGECYVPGGIGRSEPFLRHAGATVIDEPIDSEMRSGAERRLRSLVNDTPIDMIIAHDLNGLGLARKLTATRRVPIVFIASRPLTKPSLFAFSSLRRQLEHVDTFVVPSQWMASHLAVDHEIAHEKIAVIREGIDLESASFEAVSSERAASLAQSWGAIEDASDLVVIPAFFHDTVWREKLYKFALALQKNPIENTRFLIIGDDGGSGAQRNLERKIVQNGQAPVLQFVGHCADLEAAVKLASMVLIFDTPHIGNLPMALLSQALGRLTIISGDNPASSEFLINGRTGVIVNDHEERLIEVLTASLNDDENARNARAMASRIFLQQHFARDAMRAELGRLISSLAPSTDS